jgi:hypothetical protein
MPAPAFTKPFTTGRSYGLPVSRGSRLCPSPAGTFRRSRSAVEADRLGRRPMRFPPACRLTKSPPPFLQRPLECATGQAEGSSPPGEGARTAQARGVSKMPPMPSKSAGAGRVADVTQRALRASFFGANLVGRFSAASPPAAKPKPSSVRRATGLLPGTNPEKGGNSGTGRAGSSCPPNPIPFGTLRRSRPPRRLRRGGLHRNGTRPS